MSFPRFECLAMWQDVVLSLVVNTSSSLLTSGAESLLDPSDALRYANTFTALLEDAPEPESPEELRAMLDLKVETTRDRFAGSAMPPAPFRFVF